jgi:diaminohydroxyphosphoribosylaminopyrimidine deaminase/5-amino-6-(5-phosphoribosylamino)uracil reductase
MTSHLDYMQIALQLAARGRLTTSPNPMVGCVIVKKGQIIGEGFHERAGEPHAEIHALREAGQDAQGATAYVTLEPCCHQGRTPPCSKALINAGVKKVYIATLDPNPLVAGKGVAELLAHGIEVETGLAEPAAKDLNQIFFHYMTKQRPFVIAKWAMSLDGKTMTTPGDSRQISCPDSSLHTHEIRQTVDAILVGANTVRNDNPQLTARSATAAEIRQPIRVILSSDGRLPIDLKIFSKELPGKTWIATTQAVPADWQDAIQSTQVEILVLPKNTEGQVSLPDLLAELGKKGITSILVEGGMKVHESFFKLNLVDKMHVYIAPVFIGSLAQKAVISNVDMQALGRDFYVSAVLAEPANV